GKASKMGFSRMRMNPAMATSSTPWFSRESTTRWVKSTRSPPHSTSSQGTPAASANSVARNGRSATTTATGSPAARMASRLLPPPDASTPILLIVSNLPAPLWWTAERGSHGDEHGRAPRSGGRSPPRLRPPVPALVPHQHRRSTADRPHRPRATPGMAGRPGLAGHAGTAGPDRRPSPRPPRPPPPLVVVEPDRPGGGPRRAGPAADQVPRHRLPRLRGLARDHPRGRRGLRHLGRRHPALNGPEVLAHQGAVPPRAGRPAMLAAREPVLEESGTYEGGRASREGVLAQELE